MPLVKPMAQLSLQHDDDDEEAAGDNVTVAAAHGPPGRALRPQCSYKLSETLTYRQGGVVLRGGAGMIKDDGTLETDLELEHLEKKHVLGSGASARVYLVVDQRTGEQHALKELNAIADTDARHMAVNELSIARDANSPHLVKFIDAFFNEGKISILMEYADGGSLEQLIKRVGKVPEAACQGVAFGMLHGLQYLHRELHQVHRDIKPGNVMIKAGVVKLSDFGISKQLESTACFATTQVGTTAYMSPERMRGEPHSYASDVWSVGLTILESYIGETAYPPASTFMQQMSMVVDGPPPTPPDGTSPAFVEFVAQCLEKDPALRSSVGALLSGNWLMGVDDSEFGRWFATI